MINDSTRTRIAVGTVATVAVVLFAAACGGGSGSRSPNVAHVAASAPSGTPSPHGSASGDAVAYSRCMRSHGVPNYPDPGSDGGLPKTGAKDLGVDPSQYDAAQQACQSALPATNGSFDNEVRQCYQAGNCPPALVQQMLTVGRAFAACMRSHGVPNWPDPTMDQQGRPIFDLRPVGITHDQTHSPEMSAKIDACGDASGGALGTAS